MMSPGKPEAPKGGAERPHEPRAAAGGDDKSKQQGTGAQGGYEQPGGFGPQGYQMPPPWWWGMQPGMGGPYGMYGGMPPGPQDAAQHHHHRPWEPPQPPNYAPMWPWSWMSWFMPWLGPWWSWMTSWFVWPGASWMAPPFSPFPGYPGGPMGPGSDPTMRFAETRAAFYRHWFEAQAAVFRQAANASYVGYPPGYVPPPPAPQVDIVLLKEALQALPEPQAALVVHAVQMLQAWDGMRPQQRAGSDW